MTFSNEQLDGGPLRTVNASVILRDGTSLGAIVVAEPLTRLNEPRAFEISSC